MRTKKPPVAKTLITHKEIALRCSVDAGTLRTWVEPGLWPQPHSIIERTWFYPRPLVEHWFSTGSWPDEAKFMPGEGRGRVKTSA